MSLYVYNVLFHLQIQFVAYLKTSMFPHITCTGSIISDRHILTVASCFDYPDIERAEVFFGTTLNVAFPAGPINFIMRTVYMKDIITHERYNFPKLVCVLFFYIFLIRLYTERNRQFILRI